jgi:hypothetical protein
MKKLALKKEVLADLTLEEMAVVGGAAGADAPSMNIAWPTYNCPTNRCVIVISGYCFQNFTNGCTGC